MCRLFGYLGNDPSLLPLAFQQTRDSLTEDCAIPGEGWGLGFFQEDRALVRKRPKMLTDHVSFSDLASDLRARAVIGLVRRGSRGDVSPENTPPFRFRNWLFIVPTDLPSSDLAHASLRDHLPDFLRHNIWGQTDSEPALHLFFHHLRQRAHLESPSLPPQTLIDSALSYIDDLQSLLRSAHQERPPELNLLFINGRSLLAIHLHSAIPLSSLSISHLQSQETPLFAGHRPRTIDYPHFRGSFIAFQPTLSPSAPTWNPLPINAITVIDEQNQVHMHAL
jgi:predicted glutamine amidotransferase